MSNNKIYEMITEKIIEQLEQGVIPWHKPWFGTPDGPFSRSTGKPYSFINQVLLDKPGEYLTFKQIQEAGGKLKKGTKGKQVVFFKPYKIEEKDDEGNTTEKTIPLLRYYTVFHIDDTEGVEPLKKPECINNEPIETAERIINNYINSSNAPKFINNKLSDRAFYRPATDEVVVPMITQYENVEEYYSTAFHELTHSTLTESRCNRKSESSIAAFGSEDYSKEELVAELGAASLVNISGIETEKSFNNSASYIQSWLEALRNDKKMITLAATKAEQAVDFILNAEPENKTDNADDKKSAESKKSTIVKAQEAIFTKHTKKAKFFGNYNGFNCFTDKTILFGTKLLQFECPESYEKICSTFLDNVDDDVIDIDILNLDIKAIKAMKGKDVLIKTESGIISRYDIKLIQDALKFLGIKKDKVNVKIKTLKNSAFTLINENGFVTILPKYDANVTESYNIQCKTITVLNK